MNRLALLLVTGLLAGCDLFGTSGTVTFTAHKASYAPGDTATATLNNGSNQTVKYNLCLSHLERKADTGWVFAGPGVTCHAIAQVLPPGERERYRLTLADSLNLPQGPYRLATSVEMGGELVSLQTQPFDVRAANQSTVHNAR